MFEKDLKMSIFGDKDFILKHLSLSGRYYENIIRRARFEYEMKGKLTSLRSARLAMIISRATSTSQSGT